MAKSAPLINNFTGGELSPKLDARSDLQKYYSGCKIVENMIPLVEGGVVARPGLYFVTEVKDSSKKAKLFPFQFSTVQAYIIEAGEEYFRFYKDQAQITSGGSAYEVTSPYSETEVPQLKITQSADILYMANRSHNIKKLSRTGHTSWTLTDFISAVDVAMTITGASQANPCVITATLGTDGTFPSAGDIVYITGVTGMTELNGLFFDVANPNSVAGTFELSGINSTAYTAYGGTGTATRTRFGTDGNNPGAIAFFEQRFMAAGTDNDPLDVHGSASADFENFTQDAEDASMALQYSLLSDKVDAVNWMLGEEFLMIGTFGGVWRLGASSTSDPLTADNVIAKRQLSNGVMDMDAEMVGDSVLYVQRGGTTVRKAAWIWERDKYVAQDVTRVAKHIAKGATAALSGITDMDYQSEPMSILWSVRADGQLLGMVYEPDENIYAWLRVVTDGEFESVAVITAEGEEDQVWVIVKRTIQGATRRYVEYFKPHEFFSVYEDAFFVDSGLTWDGGAVNAIQSIEKTNPCKVNSSGHTFTNGMKVRISAVEGMTEVNQGLTAAYTVSNAVAGVSFTLSGIDATGWSTYLGGGTAQRVAITVSGMSHLAGETVAVLTNHGKHPSVVVSGAGVVTLTWYANVITVGLPYQYNLKPMKIDPANQEGSGRGKRKRIYRMLGSFYETAGAKWGPDEDNLTDISFGIGTAPTLFTGDMETDFDMDYETGATIHIQGESPLPLTILSLAPSLTGE